MKITIVNHERNIKRYTRVDLDEFVAQLADGTYAPAGYHEPTRDVCFAAEVGLSGEIRPVAQVDRRIGEAARLGFKKIFVSSYSATDGAAPSGIGVVKVADVPALVKALFK